MFTGLIEDTGEIIAIDENTEGRQFTIKTRLASEIEVDNSVATNGVCLTATHISQDAFTTQAVHVTLEKTSLGSLKVGARVNLELALRAQDRLGGHFVQGHVNNTATFIKRTSRGENYHYHFTLPADLLPYIVQEGSIAVEGISLTVASLDHTELMITIIPYTHENTNLSALSPGDLVNIEVDILAKYVENILKHRKS